MNELLKRISNNRLIIELDDDGDLQLLTSNNNIDSELLNEIKQNKEALISHLVKNKNNNFLRKEHKGIPRCNKNNDYALSNAQLRLWITSQVEESSISFNMPRSIFLDGTYDVVSFQKAVHSVIERHEILRTVFKINDSGEVRQNILTSEEFNFSIDFKDFTDRENAQNLVEEYIQLDSYKPFDLDQGPIFRTSLLKLSEDNYVFYYNMHHIISDGRSMEILSRDVMEYYNAHATGQKVQLLSLPIQYKDYAAWQLDQLKKKESLESRDYWLKKLSGDIPRIDLPTHKKRSTHKNNSGKSLSTALSKNLTNQLNQFIKNNEGSLFTSLLAVINLLVYKYTAIKDIAIGGPITDRLHPDLEDQIGFYINTLVFRNKIKPKANFIDFYNTTKESVLNDFAHQQYPFDKIAEDLKVKNEQNRPPLYDISLTLHNDKDVAYSRNDDEIQVNGPTKNKNDIEFHFTKLADVITFDIVFNDMYDDLMMSNLMVHFKQLLSTLLSVPEMPLKDVNYLSKEESTKLLIDFNKSEIDCSQEKTMIDLFSEQVNKNPSKIAVVSENKKLTYQELDERSNQLANCLQSEYGIKKGDFIGIHLDRSEQYIVCFLAILKSGGVHVPIDTNYPKERKEHMLKDAAISLLITDTTYMFDFSYYENTLMALDVEFEAECFSKNFKSSVSPTDLAYVIYTSGSTGKPKGVMIGHQALLNSLLGQIEVYNVNEDVRAVQFTSYSFDVSVSEILIILLSGANLHVANEEMRNSPEMLGEYIMENKINFITLPASFFHLMAPESLCNIKTLIVGGEASDLSKVNSVLAYGVEFYNSYGPSETTICVAVFKMDNSTKLESNNIPIGKPIGNNQVLILSENLQLMPIGLEGEIYIGGSQLAEGYLNSPKLTEKAFLENPFKQGEKIYKTGDSARWLPDGTIEFLGRKDKQVKIRGHRIELGEIEHVLNMSEEVDQSLVLAKDDNSGLKQLIAYIVLNTETAPLFLKKQLEGILPEYMIPRAYISLEKIPLTTNGKVDYGALPLPDGQSYHKEKFVAPVTDEESTLILVWKSVLGIKEISIKDNFYNLGGDSIKSIQIVSRLREYGYSLKVGDVLSAPILEDMAKALTKVSNVIDQSEVEGEVMLTPIQHILFELPSISNPYHFNQSILLKSEKHLDRELLELSFNELLKHHDALRMVFTKEKDGWKQYNRKFTPESSPIEFADLRAKEDPLKFMQDSCQKLQRSIQLSEGPLFIISHFMLGDGDRLALICHHSIIDGVSWRILLEDFSYLYNQHKAGKEVSLPLKTDSFKRWSLLQNDYAHSPEIKKEYNYWKKLHSISIEDFPTEKGNKENKKRPDRKVSFTFDKDLTSLMQTSIHDVYHTEINDILLSSLGLAIKKVFNVDRTVVEMEGHGREDIMEDIDISRTVGWFTSIYPIVLEVADSEEKSRTLISVKDNLRKIKNKGIGYGTIKHLGEGFSTELAPTIQFNYLGDFGNKIGNSRDKNIFEYGSENIGDAIDPENVMSAIIGVSGSVVMGELTMSISYRSDLYEEETMDNFIASYRDNLRDLIEELAEDEQSYATPSDFTFSNLHFEDVQELNAENQLEDVYELSSAQLGMYYHWFSSEDAYFEQASYRVKGSGFVVKNFKKAYDNLVSRYAILRTSFTNKYADSILQVVKKSVPSGFNYIKVPDEIDLEYYQDWVEKIKILDKKEGFNLAGPSQMRLTVIDLGNEEYEFIWSHHHILMDGWCTSILINDFYKILKSIETNFSVDLPKVYPYSDYIKWLGEVDIDSTFKYWEEYLNNYDSVVIVPFAKARVSSEGYDFHDETMVIGGNLYNRMIKLCNNLGITLNTFIQVAWGYLLSRYNDTQDVVYGSVVSGRPANLDGAEEMVGLFLNTIPVRIKYSDDETVKDLFIRTKEEAIESLPHHYASLSSVQSRSELGMDLINHIMIFENYPIQELLEEHFEDQSQDGLSTLEFESVEIQGKTNYDFNVAVGTSDTELRVHFQFNKNKYDKELISNIGGHFKNIIESFTDQPNIALKDVEFLSQAERLEILSVFNATEKENPTEITLLNLFENEVKKSKDAIAVVFNGESLSYSELDIKSNQLANYLLAKGAKNGDLIGIYMDKSFETIITVLAVLKCGGTYVPIDTGYPVQRVEYIIADSNICFLITDQLKDDLTNESENIQTFSLSKIGLDLLEQSEQKPSIAISASETAYVIYTSGSTGKPKGTAVSHHNILNIAYSWKQSYGLNNESCILQIASFSFDVFSGDIFRSLLFGGKLVICPIETRLDFVSLYELFSTWKVNNVEMTPALAIEFLEYVYDNDLDISSLEVLILGADILHVADYQRLLSRYGNSMRILNSYGTTETTIDSSYFETQNPEYLDTLAHVPIGKPLANTSFYLLDSKKRLMPAGLVGELYIGGAGVAKGYVNRPQLTGEKFLKDIFKKDGRMFKTGDFARWLPDGNMEFLGRQDYQVKVRGYRIELGEIETAIDAIPEVLNSLVLAKETNYGTPQLVAYVVLDNPIETSEIQRLLNKGLPDYMVPTLFVMLDEMPLTHNGKVDRKALSEIIVKAQKDYEPPTTATEEKLIAIWEEALALEKISINDNFFELGGNSLSAVKIILRIRRLLDVEIDIKNLFEFNTVSDLALHIDFSVHQDEILSNNTIVKQII